MIKQSIIRLFPRKGRIMRGLSKGLRFDTTGGTLKYLLGNLESDEENLIESLIDMDMIVYDVGANIGYYAIGIARKIGKNGSVHAF